MELFVGIDVSKLRLDIHIGELNHSFQLDNSSQGVKELIQYLSSLKKYTIKLVIPIIRNKDQFMRAHFLDVKDCIRVGVSTNWFHALQDSIRIS